MTVDVNTRCWPLRPHKWQRWEQVVGLNVTLQRFCERCGKQQLTRAKWVGSE